MALDLGVLAQYVGDKLNVSTFVGGMLLSFLFLIMVVLSVSRFTRSNLVTVISAVVSLIFCTGIGWIPSWVVILICMIVAIEYGNLAQKKLGG